MSCRVNHSAQIYKYTLWKSAEILDCSYFHPKNVRLPISDMKNPIIDSIVSINDAISSLQVVNFFINTDSKNC